MAELRLNNVAKRFGDATVLHGVDLAVSDGEFVVFVGPSGCGKSTLLRTIAGLEDASSGEILIDNQRVNEVDAAKRGLAMVFQSYALYPHMNVAENMGFGLKLAKLPKDEIVRRIRDAAEILRIDHLLERFPKTLSGGQRQRVAIGRAIVREPKIFLFDEPLSNLDAELRVQMRVEIAKLHARLKATMIYVTHDQVEAMTLADKIVVLRGGRVEQIGTPLELYNQPGNLFVAGFIGSPRMNFLTTEVAAAECGQIDVSLPDASRLVLRGVNSDGLTAGESVTLGIRPEHVVVDADATEASAGAVTHLSCKLLLAEQLGSETYLHLLLPGGGETLVAQAAGQRISRPGEIVTVLLRANVCHLFGRDGVALSRVAAVANEPELRCTGLQLRPTTFA